MALDPDDGLLAVGDDQATVLDGLGRSGRASTSSRSGTATARTSPRRKRLARIREAWPALEQVEVRTGGQPHYRFLLSAE